MKLFEFTDLANVEVHVYHTPNAVSQWIANIKTSFYDVFFKDSNDDIMARGCTGWGETPQDAINDLIHNLKEHKIMVVDPGVHAQGSPRRQYNLPKSLE